MLIVPQATVHRHVDALADGGMLAVADERQVRGGTGRRDAVDEARVHLSADDLRGFDDDELTANVGALRAALADARTNGPAPGRRRRLLTTILHPAE